MLKVKNLCLSYGEQLVLDNISFSINEGEFLSMIGHNGAGKTSLYKCLLYLNSHYSGEILLENKSISGMSPGQIAKKIAYIPQVHYMAFNFRVVDMVLMGTTASLSPFKGPGKKQKERALTSLEMLEIKDLANKSYFHLSGGQQQLVLIARALASNSTILLLDEPTSNLDLGNQFMVMKQIKKLSEKGYSIILSTHQIDQAYMFSDKILALNKGKIIALDSPDKVITESIIKETFKTDTEIITLKEDKIRLCVPKFN